MHPELTEAVEFHDAIVAEAGKALVGYDREKALANIVLMSEIGRLRSIERMASRSCPAIARGPPPSPEVVVGSILTTSVMPRGAERMCAGN